MTPAAQTWERVYTATMREPSQTRNALACRRRREQLRASGLCIFCGHKPAPSLCDDCRGTQSEQSRERYKQRRAALEGTPHALRRYTRRKAVRP
jgi:hypothetical protein